MRAFLTVLILFSVASLASAADVAIVRVWPGYRTADSFERISEYFTGQENPSGQIVLRTQPDSRTGYYFLVRLKNPGAEIAGARAELQIVTPFSTETKMYTFTCLLPAGGSVLNLGLTGTDWPDQPTAEVVAWHLRLLGSDGAELAKQQSFLWALPEKK